MFPKLLVCLSLLLPLSAAAAGSTAAAVIAYAPDDSDFANPERGVYHQVDCSSGPIAAKLLARHRAAHDSLMCGESAPASTGSGRGWRRGEGARLSSGRKHAA